MLYQMKLIDLDKELKEVCHQLIKNKDDIRAEAFLPENFFEQMFRIENKEKIEKVLLTDCGDEIRISLIDKMDNQLMKNLKESFVQWGAFQVDETDRVHLYIKKSA